MGKVYDTVVNTLSQSCEEKIKVDEGNLELNFTPEKILISGEIFNQAQCVANIKTPKKPKLPNIEKLAKITEAEAIQKVTSTVSTETQGNPDQNFPIASDARDTTKIECSSSDDEDEIYYDALGEFTSNKITIENEPQSECVNNKEFKLDEKAKRREDLKEKLKYAAKQFGKAGTKSNHPGVPKEQQLSIDLDNKPRFNFISKILYCIEKNFKYFFLRYNLFPEVGTEKRKIPGTESKVIYFTPSEQAENALYIHKDAKLYDFKGNLYDTTNEISKGKKGCVAYVITLDGKLITHKHVNVGEGKSSYRHSTLAGGKPIICSGLIKIEKGKITYIDNNSGHYKPTDAHLYSAVKRLKSAFSEDAKVVHLRSWRSLIREIPILCSIPARKESTDRFLKRMEKKGRNGLTAPEEYFSKVKKYNEQYAQTLFRANYRSPTSEPTNKPILLKKFAENPEVKKITIEHSIRKIIEAPYGHKPRIELDKIQDGKGNELIGINIIFRHKHDLEKFLILLDCEGYRYGYVLTTQEKRDKISGKVVEEYTVIINEKLANEFIRNTLKIDMGVVKVSSALDSLTIPKSIFPSQSL